jgi:hypothetical protein
MSATMDTAKVAAYLDCPEMSAPGRAWPVEVRYQPPLPGEFVESAAARAIAGSPRATTGDVLAFLPGMREIRRVAGFLADRGVEAQWPGRARMPPRCCCCTAPWPWKNRRAVISPEPGWLRRVVLATNVAETSLTVPGVAAVVDAGLSRYMGWHPRSGLNRLETGIVSVAEAEQRRGRAGRLGPGLCIRCWDEGTSLPASRGPEIGRSGLAALVLECAARGIRFPEDLKWLDQPPQKAWHAGASLLADIGLTESPPAGKTEPGNRPPAGKTARQVVSTGRARERSARLAGRSCPWGLIPGRELPWFWPQPCKAGNGRPRLPQKASAAPWTKPEKATAAGNLAAVQATILASAVIGERDPDDFGGDGDFCSRLLRVLDGPGNERTRAILDEAGRLASRLGLGRFEPALARQAVGQAGNLLAPGFPTGWPGSCPMAPWSSGAAGVPGLWPSCPVPTGYWHWMWMPGIHLARYARGRQCPPSRR